jgi:hypothetical protein
VRPVADQGSGLPLAAGLGALAIGAAVLAGWLPLTFSIVIVFLFAGPHNWFEARYFLERLPARAGKLLPFFALSAVGVVGLTVSYPLLPVLIEFIGGNEEVAGTILALWNSAFLGWIGVLAFMRANTSPRRDWGWLIPFGFALLAVAWRWPYHFSLALVYLHPLMALGILDRELGRSKPHWRPAYRVFLAVLPVLLIGLCWHLRDAPPLPENDMLMLRIAQQAGSDWAFPGVSSHVLVAVHTCLEMIHYGIWVLVIPLVGLRQAPWKLDSIPAAKRNPWQRSLVAALLIFGAATCAALWAGFAADYLTTRDIYFAVATAHVLAEIPFLLRAL